MVASEGACLPVVMAALCAIAFQSTTDLDGAAACAAGTSAAPSRATATAHATLRLLVELCTVSLLRSAGGRRPLSRNHPRARCHLGNSAVTTRSGGLACGVLRRSCAGRSSSLRRRDHQEVTRGDRPHG